MSRTLLAVVAAVAVVGLLWYGFSYDKRDIQNSAGELKYESPELGLAFSYPPTYDVTLHEGGNDERRWYTLSLIPSDFVAPQGGEGPPSISISMFESEGMELLDWIKGNGNSNFKLSADQRTEYMTVDGMDAYRYSHSGLYETDAIAVQRDNKIYLFSAGWLTPQDKIRAEFQDLVSSVEFK